MANWKPIVGVAYSPKEFDVYCHGLQWNAWRPSFIVLHNTAIPSLKQRPNGFSADAMRDLVTYYRDERKWSAGPHLFVDDQKIWVFTPLTMSGVHSPSWNKLSLGVEMLGDYEQEEFYSGRGLKVKENSISAIATLCGVLGLDPKTMKLHKEDHLTTHNCPGKNVAKDKFVGEVEALMRDRHKGEHLTD